MIDDPAAGAAAARTYHAATAHTPERVRASRHHLDWANKPAPAKRYPDLEALPLPTGWAEPALPATAVLSGVAADDSMAPALPALARLLFLAAGVTRRLRRGAETLHFRAAPSAGALYPVEVYAVCGDLDGLDAGVFHLDPLAFALHPLRPGDWRGVLADAAADPAVARAPVTLMLTGIPWRTTWKYGARGYRHLFWDAGVVAANLLAAAAAAGWPARLLAGFDDDAVAGLLDLGTATARATGGEVPLAIVPVEPRDAAGPPPAAEPTRTTGHARTTGPTLTTGPPEPLGHAVTPLSRARVDEPSLWAVHDAGRLAGADAVRGWRDALAGLDVATAPAVVPGPPDPPTTTLEAVILQRGSTRRFTRDPVPAQALTWPLAVAGRDVPGDLGPPGATLLTHLAAVHAVEGYEPGAYRATPDGRPSADRPATPDRPAASPDPPATPDRPAASPDPPATPDDPEAVLARLERPLAREVTAALCLGQPLGGDAAYTAFHCAALDALLDVAGARAYRAAQLEAGVASGRLQLAAFALGAGATGLTFFDEHVREAFGTTAWPMLVSAVGRPAYRASPGRRPA